MWCGGGECSGLWWRVVVGGGHEWWLVVVKGVGV
jgi:hypothetical protein